MTSYTVTEDRRGASTVITTVIIHNGVEIDRRQIVLAGARDIRLKWLKK